MDSDEKNRVRTILTMAITMSLFLAAAGFWLSWGRSSMTNANNPFDPSPVRYQITLQHTGKHASFYGYGQLGVGVGGGMSALLAAGLLAGGNRSWRTAVQLTIALAFVGLLMHVTLRMDPQVTLYGSVGSALSNGDLTLGYTIGPGLGIIGFAAAVVLGVAALKAGPASEANRP